MNNEKTCAKCGAAKPLDEFLAKGNQCKTCKAEYNRKWRKANPEKAAEHNRNWREANPEKKAEHTRKWYQANREKAAEHTRKWYQANREKAAEYSRKWYQANREKAAEHARKWREANPEKAAEYSRRRRARKAGVESDGHTTADQHDYWRSKGIDPETCYYCNRPVENWETSEGDHVIPIVKGGPDTVENIVPCCPKVRGSKVRGLGNCQSSKKDKLLFTEWTPPIFRDEATLDGVNLAEADRRKAYLLDIMNRFQETETRKKG